jgi:hypothetical protein
MPALFGLPARRSSRPNVVTALKDDVAGGGVRVGRVHRIAATMQVAMAVPFLVISGVMLDRVGRQTSVSRPRDWWRLVSIPLRHRGRSHAVGVAHSELRKAQAGTADRQVTAWAASTAPAPMKDRVTARRP